MLSRKTKVLLFLALLGVVFLAVAWLALRDEPPPADAHLRAFRRNVKEEENGFRFVDLKEQDLWNDGEEPVLDWHSSTLDLARAAELVEKNGAILEKLDRCLALPDFQVDVAGFNDFYPYLNAWRDLADVLAIRARLYLESGRPLDAVEDGSRIVRFGRRVRSSQGHLIVYVIGTAIEHRGLGSLVYTAVHGKVPPEGLRRAIEVLNEGVPEARWFQDSLKAEYVAISETVDDMAEGKVVDVLQMGFAYWLLRRPLFKPNETKRLLCEDIGFLVSAASLPRRERVPLDAGKYERSWLGRFTGGGKALAGLVVPKYESILTRADLIRFQSAAAQVLFALQLARAETDGLPASLDEIVPRYLPSVPVDPFDGKPLRYSASNQVIYSVGADGKDAGGSDQENPKEAFRHEDEPTLRFSVEAWRLEAQEKTKEDDTKRAKKRTKRKKT